MCVDKMLNAKCSSMLGVLISNVEHKRNELGNHHGLLKRNIHGDHEGDFYVYRLYVQ